LLKILLIPDSENAGADFHALNSQSVSPASRESVSSAGRSLSGSPSACNHSAFGLSINVAIFLSLAELRGVDGGGGGRSMGGGAGLLQPCKVTTIAREARYPRRLLTPQISFLDGVSMSLSPCPLRSSILRWSKPFYRRTIFLALRTKAAEAAKEPRVPEAATARS
jgi:hypothetical protein